MKNMGSKNNPPVYDCYKNAEPDEEMFVLLGRDPMAGTLVRLWVQLREYEGTIAHEKAEEARACANRLDEWATKLGKGGRVERSKHIMVELLTEFLGNVDRVKSGGSES